MTTAILISCVFCFFCSVVAVALLIIQRDRVCRKFSFLKVLCRSPSPRPDANMPSTGSKMPNTGDVRLTAYWVARAGDRYLMDCGSSLPKTKEAKAKHTREVVLNSLPNKSYTINGAAMDGYMWDACYCEGTCQINGQTHNLDKEARTIKDVKFKTKAGLHWGMGPEDNDLVPFVSITADNQYKLKTKLFIEALKGMDLGNGKVHNGCVRVDDQCGDGCSATQMDIHMGTYDMYKKLENKLPDKVSVKEDPSCKIGAYM